MTKEKQKNCRICLKKSGGTLKYNTYSTAENLIGFIQIANWRSSRTLEGYSCAS
jgi:hypothetical protein